PRGGHAPRCVPHRVSGCSGGMRRWSCTRRADGRHPSFGTLTPWPLSPGRGARIGQDSRRNGGEGSFRRQPCAPGRGCAFGWGFGFGGEREGGDGGAEGEGRGVRGASSGAGARGGGPTGEGAAVDRGVSSWVVRVCEGRGGGGERAVQAREANAGGDGCHR